MPPHFVQVADPLHLSYRFQNLHPLEVAHEGSKPHVHQRHFRLDSAELHGALEQLLIEVHDRSRHRYASFISGGYHRAHSFTTTRMPPRPTEEQVKRIRTC